MKIEETQGEKFIKEMERKRLKFSEEDLWKFSLKEICLNMECDEFNFCTDIKRYCSFERRFNYFVKRAGDKLNE